MSVLTGSLMYEVGFEGIVLPLEMVLARRVEVELQQGVLGTVVGELWRSQKNLNGGAEVLELGVSDRSIGRYWLLAGAERAYA